MSEDEFFCDENYTANSDATDSESFEDVNFEEELENYLPTPQNTDKLKKQIPPWLVSGLASALGCLLILAVYSFFVLPNIRPTAVISYSDGVSADLSEEATDIAGFIEKITPGIVTVTSQSDYRSFFGISTQNNSGSGVVISENGYILTSNTLIGSNGEANVVIGKDSFPAKIVGQDISKDIAIIQIEKTGLTPITFGNSDSVRAGDVAIVVGNLLGNDLGVSVTKGIICGINKGVSLSNGNSINLIQTDAVTGTLSTGGCILNSSGNVVGMITSAISSGNDSISLAIPSNDISMIAESLINTGLSPSGLIIGITGNDAEHGVTVESVADDTPAKKAGIKKGDLILKVDGTVVKSISEINKIRDTHKKGDTIVITIYRDGEIINLNVKL